jgi:hypothetical protein
LVLNGCFNRTPRPNEATLSGANNPEMDEYWNQINAFTATHRNTKPTSYKRGDTQVDITPPKTSDSFWVLTITNKTNDQFGAIIYFKINRSVGGQDILFEWLADDTPTYAFYGDADAGVVKARMESKEFLLGMEYLEEAAVTTKNKELTNIFLALLSKLEGRYVTKILKDNIKLPSSKRLLFRGTDLENKTCYLALEGTDPEKPLKIRLISAQETTPETVSAYLFGLPIISNSVDHLPPAACHTFEVDLASGRNPFTNVQANLWSKDATERVGLFGTVKAATRSNANGGSSIKTTVGLTAFGRAIFSCEKTSIKICDGNAQATQSKVNYGFFATAIKYISLWSEVPEAMLLDFAKANIIITIGGNSQKYSCNHLTLVDNISDNP